MTTRTRARLAETPAIESDDEKRVVEALIFVADEPVTLDQMAQVLGHRTPDELQALVTEIERELESSSHGLRIERVAGGYRLSTCPDLAPWVRAFFRNRNRARLSPASIETLAVIAYKQPVTAPEIQEIRGVDPQGSLKTLLDKQLVRLAGKKKVVGRPFLYATTREFLVHFGLASIEDLPPIEDFERLAGSIEAAPGITEAGELEGAPDGAPDPEALLPDENQEGPEGEGMGEGDIARGDAEDDLPAGRAHSGLAALPWRKSGEADGAADPSEDE